MKAAVFKQAGLLAVEERPVPAPGPGEALVKVAYCGICGSDLHRYQHGLMAPGVVMGHEYSGTIVALGEGVTGWQVGERVVRGIKARLQAVNPRYSAREKGFTVDVKQPGGYAEYAVLPAAALLRLPEGLSEQVAALAEPLAVATHALRLSNLKLGDAVVVLGAGPIGLCTLQEVRQMAPRLVIVSEPVAARRELALQLGADLALDPRAVDVVAEVVRLTDGLGPDVVFECAGARPTLQQALEMPRWLGQVVLVALCMDGCQVSPLDWVGREVQVQCAYGTAPEDWRTALALLAGGKVQGEPMISQVVPLDEIQSAFQSLLHPSEEQQVLVRP
ncbi:MAG: zinc-dependent alcohol dehydrogenase [Chloroflexota bacterium]